MARKRYKPEEIVSLLRQAEVLHGQGLSMADAIWQLGISEVTFYRWRKEYAGMSGDQLRRLKEREKQNEQLRRAVSDLTLDKQILKEAAGGNFFSVRGPRVNAPLVTSPSSATSARLALLVVKRRRLTPRNQRESTRCHADRRPIYAPNNTLDSGD